MTKQDFLDCREFKYDIGNDVYAYSGHGKILLRARDGQFYDYCRVDKITNNYFESTIKMFGMPHIFIMMYKRCTLCVQ